MRREMLGVCNTFVVKIRPWGWVLLMFGSFGVVAACSDSSGEATPVSTTTYSPTTTYLPCNLDDEVPEKMIEWNSIAHELTVAFGAISLRPEYSHHSERLVPRLESALQRIEHLTECLVLEQRRPFEELLLAYRARLDGYAALESAWSSGSASEQQVAIEQIIDAHREAWFAVCEISRMTDGEFPGAESC